MNEAHPAGPNDQGGGADCVVVGAGLSGLAAGLTLARDGYTVQVVDGAPSIGGRVRGGMHHGEPADAGFQTVLRGYPTVSELLTDIGINSAELHTFERRMVVHDGAKWRRLKVLGPGSVMTSGLMSRGDVVRLIRLAGRAGIGGARELDGGHHQTAAEMFAAAGIGRTSTEMVLRPLLGSMMLDRTLEADAGYTRFLLGMMARGPAVLPVDGIGMITDRTATALRAAGGMLWNGTTVAAITLGEDGRATGVQLVDGRTIRASSVILAVDAGTAKGLLSGVDDLAAARLPSEPAGCVSATFALERPLYEDATILLDGAAPEGTDRLDLICQTTNVTRPGSPGPHILVAQSATAGWSAVDPGRYADRALDRLRTLIPSYDWSNNVQLVDATDHPNALYRVTPGVRENLPGPRTMVRNLVLAGDATMHPSLEGAVSAGTRAAGVVADLLQ